MSCFITLVYLFGDAKGVEISRFLFGRTEQYRQTNRGRRRGTQEHAGGHDPLHERGRAVKWE